MNQTDLNAIIVQGDARVLITQAEVLGKQLAQQRLTTNQIRNIFGTVRRIEMNWPAERKTEADCQRATRAQRDLLLLKPKMAYQAKREGRDKGQGVEMLRQVLDPAIDLVAEQRELDPAIDLVAGQRERFQHFVDFFEAILAYHKSYGGN